MKREITIYRENEQKINRLYFYLICGGIVLGAILVIAIKLFTPAKTTLSYWHTLYILGGGAVLMSIPAYFIRFQPDKPVIKYLLAGCNIGLVIFVNILLAKISQENFLNFFWVIIFASLYFNKKVSIFAVAASIMSYLLMVILIPEVRPVGYQSFQASVATRIFYLSFAGVGCIILTKFANALLERIMDHERKNQETLREISGLLKDVAIGGATLTASTQELQSYTEDTSISIDKTRDVVESIGLDAVKIREGMTKARTLLNSLAENADRHQDLSARTIELTENIVATATKGLDDVAEIGQEINNVALQFESTLETIEELNRDSQNIGEIVQTISNIAEQTKMLSMNAAIEAARAGEYGRGFAVVASKINKLSVQTQETLKQIEAIIKKFLPQLATTVTHTKETAVVLEKGIENVNQINGTFARISSTLKEGLPLLEDVSKFIRSQALIINEIDLEVSNAHRFSIASETGMNDLNQVFNKFMDMAHMLSASTQELSSLAETLTMQARTKFSDAELEQDNSNSLPTPESQKSAEEIELDELIKSIDFDDAGLDEFDLEALERSLSVSNK